MGTFTKENILSIIAEQLSSTMQLDEFPNRKRGEDPKDWYIVNGKLTPPKVFRESEFKPAQEVYAQYRIKSLVGAVKILSLKPDVRSAGTRDKDVRFNEASEEELEQGVAYCYEEWQSKLNPMFKLYTFDNYGYLPPIVDEFGNKLYQKFKMFIFEKGDEPGVPQALFRNEPRNTFFETRYKSKETPQYSSETYTKKYLHFDKINYLFNDSNIKTHLIKCAIPPIMAYKEFDLPTTHRIKDQHQYTAPNYNFLLSGLWEGESLQNVLNNIIKYREAVALDDTLPDLPKLKHMPRNPQHKFVYRRGAWEHGQKIQATGAEKTKRLKLWMKAIAGGKLSTIIVSNLQIIGTVEPFLKDIIMTATFSVFTENRAFGEDSAGAKTSPIDPISVHVRMHIPDDVGELANVEDEMKIELTRGGKNSKEYIFLSQVYDALLSKLAEKILEIDPDEAIDKYLSFEASDIEANIEETVKPKIIITEEQLQTLLQRVNKKTKLVITEDQLKELLKEIN